MLLNSTFIQSEAIQHLKWLNVAAA